MTLRQSVTQFAMQHLPPLPESPRVAASRKTLEALFEDAGRAPKAADAARLERRFREALAQGALNRMLFRDWRQAAWIAFGGEKPLARERGFLDALLQAFRERRRKGAYRTLIQVYLRDFDPENVALRRVAEELAAVAAQFEWAWGERHAQYRLFDMDSAPRAVASAGLAAGPPPLARLEEMGLGAGSGGLTAHAWLRALQILQEALTQARPNAPALLNSVLAWTAPEGRLLYPHHRAALATAILMPWRDRSPDKGTKDRLTNFLLDHFKDPRLPINAKEWVSVPDEAVAVLRKWLTGVALEQFFQVVDQVAQENMWRFRRAFWLAYHNIDAISDAWVLFGPQAQDYARRAFGKTQSYGILDRGDGASPDHSVLLMKIGSLTVADWSHNGKCHIWLNGNPKTPKLYLGRYSRSDVIYSSDNGGQVHSSSANGNWQGKVEGYIRKHTGISLTERQYMPDDWRRW